MPAFQRFPSVLVMVDMIGFAVVELNVGFGDGHGMFGERGNSVPALVRLNSALHEQGYRTRYHSRPIDSVKYIQN